MAGATTPHLQIADPQPAREPVGGDELVARAQGEPEPRPAVVLVHGGSLVAMGRYEMSGAARGLAEAGYVTFNIDYRLFSALDGTNPWLA